MFGLKRFGFESNWTAGNLDNNEKQSFKKKKKIN